MSKSSISQFWDKIEELYVSNRLVFTTQQTISDDGSTIYAVAWSEDYQDREKDMCFLVCASTDTQDGSAPEVCAVTREMLKTMYALGKNL